MAIHFTTVNEIFFMNQHHEARNGIISEFSNQLKEVDKGFISRENLLKFLAKYSDQELHLLLEDFIDIQRDVFMDVSQVRQYLVTTGKTTKKLPLLEKELKTRAIKFAYISEERIYQKMAKTYMHSLTGKTESEARVHWKKGAYFISNALFALGLNRGLAIAQEALPIDTKLELGLSKVKNEFHYIIELFHVSCAKEVDENEKLFFINLKHYLKFSHEMHFYYQTPHAAILAGEKLISGSFIPIKAKELEEIKKLHTAACGHNYWDKVMFGSSSPNLIPILHPYV